MLDGLLNSGLRLKLLCGLLSVRGCLLGVFRHLGGNALTGGVNLRAQLIVLSAISGFTPSAASCARPATA